MTDDLTTRKEPRKGRRSGDNNPKSLRDIDNIHRANWMYFIGELTRLRKAVEAIAARDIVKMQQTLDDLKKGDGV